MMVRVFCALNHLRGHVGLRSEGAGGAARARHRPAPRTYCWGAGLSLAVSSEDSMHWQGRGTVVGRQVLTGRRAGVTKSLLLNASRVPGTVPSRNA